MRLQTILIIAILTIAAVLRFYGLGAKVLWQDEAMSWRLLTFSLPELIHRSGGTGTVHPPLFYMCLRPWVALFGVSEVSLRFLPALFGVLAVFGAFIVTREIDCLSKTQGSGNGDPQLGALLAAALVALNPMQIHLAKQARGYSLAIALVTCSSWALLRALRGGKHSRAFWGLYAVLTLLLCYTHYVGLFLVAAQGAFIALYLAAAKRAQPLSGDAHILDQQARIDYRHRQVWLASIVLAVIVAGYAVWAPSLFKQSATVADRSWQPALTMQRIALETSIAISSTFASRSTFSPSFAWMVTGFVLLAMLALFARDWDGRFIAILGVVPAVLTIVYSAIVGPNLYYSRYLSLTEIIWLVALGYFVGCLRNVVVRWVFAIILVCASAYCCYQAWDVVGPGGNPGMRAAAMYIQDNVKESELIYAGDYCTFLELLYYCRDGAHPSYIVDADQVVPGATRTAHLTGADLITLEQASALKSTGIWRTYRTGWPRPKLPSGNWLLRETENFEQDYRWEGTVIIEHYRRAEDR